MNYNQNEMVNQHSKVLEWINRVNSLVQELRQLADSLIQYYKSLENPNKNEQLHEITHTIKRLESIGVAVPPELRSLKAELVTKVGIEERITNTLATLWKELSEIQEAIQPNVRKQHCDKPKIRMRLNQPYTERAVIREYLLKALRAKGGRASVEEVLEWMENNLRDRFKPGDLKTRSTGEVVWKNNTKWERFNLIQEGILKSDSPRGLWELSDEHRISK